jgi:hypothetical protein
MRAQSQRAKIRILINTPTAPPTRAKGEKSKSAMSGVIS